MSSPARCPKCGADGVRAEPSGACPGCGLRVALWSRFDDTPPPHPFVDEAFAALAASWDSTKAHDSFLVLARNADSLDAAAARYRRWLREHPGDEMAQRALAQAAQYVLASAQTQHANAPEQAIRSLLPLRVIGTITALVLAVIVGFTLYRTLASR